MQLHLFRFDRFQSKLIKAWVATVFNTQHTKSTWLKHQSKYTQSTSILKSASLHLQFTVTLFLPPESLQSFAANKAQKSLIDHYPILTILILGTYAWQKDFVFLINKAHNPLKNVHFLMFTTLLTLPHLTT